MEKKTLITLLVIYVLIFGLSFVYGAHAHTQANKKERGIKRLDYDTAIPEY